MQETQSDNQFCVEMLDKQGNLVTLPLEQALQEREQEAAEQEKALGLERRRISVLFVELPDVAESIDFQRLAHSLRQIAAYSPIIPETPPQAAWLRCVQLYWEAKAIAFANKIYKLFPDPMQPGGPVHKMLPTKALENLKLDVEADLAWYNMLKAGEPKIKEWVKRIESMSSKPEWAKGIHYPFENVEELFIETLKIDFESNLAEGVFSSLPQTWNRRQERDHYRGWLKFFSDLLSGEPEEETYINILRSMGWKGYALLALRDQKCNKPFDKLWQIYIKKHRPLLKFLDSRTYWRNGVPCQSNQKNGRRIKRMEAIQATLTEDGFFDWGWYQDV